MSLPYSQAFAPPAPVLDAEAFAIDRPEDRLRVTAKLDTGADISAIPVEVIERLMLQPVGTILVEGFGGSPTAVPAYWIGLELSSARIRRVKIVATADTYALLGRDILNVLYISLLGPELIFSISPKPL